MIKNQLFSATDKSGRTLKYRYIGINPQLNGYNIELLNLDWNELTFVEQEWFKQRIIKEI